MSFDFDPDLDFNFFTVNYLVRNVFMCFSNNSIYLALLPTNYCLKKNIFNSLNKHMIFLEKIYILVKFLLIIVQQLIIFYIIQLGIRVTKTILTIICDYVIQK